MVLSRHTMLCHVASTASTGTQQTSEYYTVAKKTPFSCIHCLNGNEPFCLCLYFLLNYLLFLSLFRKIVMTCMCFSQFSWNYKGCKVILRCTYSQIFVEIGWRTESYAWFSKITSAICCHAYWVNHLTWKSFWRWNNYCSTNPFGLKNWDNAYGHGKC